MSTQFSGPPNDGVPIALWRWLENAWQIITQLANANQLVIAPTTGFTQQIPPKVDQLIVNAAGVLASGTITLPATPKNGQQCGITSTYAITALTVNSAAGTTVVNPATTLAVSSTACMGVRFVFDSASSKWFRVQ